MEWPLFMFGVAVGGAVTGLPALYFLELACKRETELQAELATVKEQLAERFSEVVK